MTRALTTEQVNKRLAPIGIRLLGEWQGQKKKHRFACLSGHEWETTHLGRGCPKCSMLTRTHRPKRTTEAVNTLLSSRGISLVGEWQGGKKRHNFKCAENGHIWEALGQSTVDGGNGCPFCYAERNLWTEEEVKTLLASKGIQLSSEWKGSHEKHRFICSQSHEWETTGASVIHNTGCPSCYQEERWLTKAQVADRLSSRGIRLVGKWHGTEQPNRFKCQAGHIWTALGTSLVNHNKGCPQCADLNKMLSQEEVVSRLSPRGLSLIGKWRGTGHKHSFLCSCGHKWRVIAGPVVTQGHGCPKCNNASYPKLTRREVNMRLKPKGMRLIGKWRGGHKDNRFVCSLGHKWVTQGSGPVMIGSGCPECARNRRKALNARGF